MFLQKKTSNYDKVKTLGRSSEAFFEISKQPTNTCPLIDSVIESVESLSFDKGELDNCLTDAQKQIKSVIKTLQRSDVSDNGDVVSVLNELECIFDLLKDAENTEVSVDLVEVKWIVDELEEVRTNCENIRMWGQEWKDLFFAVFNYPTILIRWLFILWADRTLNKDQKRAIQIGTS